MTFWSLALVGKGFTVMAPAFCNYDDLPQILSLERFEEAGKFNRDQCFMSLPLDLFTRALLVAKNECIPNAHPCPTTPLVLEHTSQTLFVCLFLSKCMYCVGVCVDAGTHARVCLR